MQVQPLLPRLKRLRLGGMSYTLEQRAEVFGNSLLASAALDRLTHRSHFIEMNGQSYR